jgi:hypothetical protein
MYSNIRKYLFISFRLQRHLNSMLSDSDQFVANVLQRLHRSSFIHFERSTCKPLPLFTGRRAEHNRLKFRNSFSRKLAKAKEESETLSQVATMLEAFVSKKIIKKRARKFGKAFVAAKRSKLSDTTSGDENDYLGDASALASLAVLNEEY